MSLSKLVKRRIEAEGGNRAAMQKAKQATYAKNGVDLKTPAEIDAEIVAEYVSKHLLTNEQSILSLTLESPSLGRRILNWLDSVIAKLGNKVAQERTFLLNARNLYAKALFQTQGSFNAEATTTAPMNTAGSAAANGVMETKETHHSEQSGAAEISGAEELRQTIREQYANGDLSETEFDEMMELIDQQEETDSTIDIQYSVAGESSIRLEKKFEDYPYNMQTVLKEYIDAVDDKILSFVGDVRAGVVRSGDKVEVGSVSKRMADDILRITGTQMQEGDKIVLNTSAVEHIEIRHGLNGKADQSMKNGKDFARINYILQNYDHAEQGKQKNPAYRNRNNTSAKTVMFSKKINGTYYVVEAVTDTGKAGIVSAFIHKNGAAQVLDADTPSGNVRNELATTPTNIIGEDSEIVNEQFSISDQVSKQDVVNDLREILRRGGDPAELRRYVENMERGTESAAEIDSTENQDAEVQEILRAAREQNISVDEYLRRNWEQYEYDGQLNAAARTALDLEKGNVQYSISSEELQDIQSIGRKSVNDFTTSDIAKTERFAQQYWNEMGVKSPFFRAWFGDWRANDQTAVQIANVKGDTRGVQKNTDTGWDIQVSGQIFNETIRHTKSYNVGARKFLPYINSIVENAVLLDSYSFDPNKLKSNNSLLMHSLYAVADTGRGPEILKLYVEEMNDPNKENTSKRAYQLQNVEKYQLQNGSSQNNVSSISSATGSIHTVADLFAAVKQKDAAFNPKPASMLVNTDGTPKILYILFLILIRNTITQSLLRSK